MLVLVLVLVLSEAVLVLATVRTAIAYEYRFAEYRFAEYRFAEYRFAEYRFAEYRFAEYRFAEYEHDEIRGEIRCDAIHEPLLTIEVGFADFGFHADGFGKSRMEAVLVERVQEAGFLCPDACVAWLA